MRPSGLLLAVLALFILGPAAAAMSRRSLVHGALLLAASWAGVAAFYLWAGAEFVAFAQVLIYVGAISIVVLFAVALTGRADPGPGAARPSRRRAAGSVAAAALVAGAIAWAAAATPLPAGPAPALSLRALGETLAGPRAASLLAAGAILTVALLGAIVLAAASRGREEEDSP